MKRALRNTETAMFVKPDLGETGLIDQACCFDNYQEAFDFCSANQLTGVELVVRVSDRYEFTVAIPAIMQESQAPEEPTSHSPPAADLFVSK